MTQPVDPADLVIDAIKGALGACPLCDALVELSRPLVHYLEGRIEKNQAPNEEIYKTILTQADALADEAEDIKFGPERPTKP